MSDSAGTTEGRLLLSGLDGARRLIRLALHVRSEEGRRSRRLQCGDLGPVSLATVPVRLDHDQSPQNDRAFPSQVGKGFTMTIEGGGLNWERPADALGRVAPWLRGRQPAPRPRPTRVFLATTGCFVGDDEIRRDGAFFQVWAEDVAWQFSVRDWQGRRPRFWAFRRTRRWRAEYALLAKEQDRIAERARFYGVTD